MIRLTGTADCHIAGMRSTAKPVKCFISRTCVPAGQRPDCAVPRGRG